MTVKHQWDNFDISLPAPAKLNLFLHIIGQRNDGYHELQTIFQLLNFGDYIGLNKTSNNTIIRLNELEGVAEQDDLVVRAALALQQKSGCAFGAEIFVDKQLPMGGGIGGGSSDAASVLLGLNKLWGLNYSIDELAQIGLDLGADVPVFVKGRTAWAEGVGDLITPVDLDEKWYLVLTPQVSVSTAQLFSAQALTRDCTAITIRDFEKVDTFNVFEPLVRAAYPQVDEALKALSQYSTARLTGTGACVFAGFNSQESALNAKSLLGDVFEGFVAKGVNHSPAHAKI